MTQPMISMEQMIVLHGFFAEAAAVGEARLAEISGRETEVDVVEIRCVALGDFGDRGLWLSEDLVAGVMGRLDGSMPGSLNLVLEPEEALAWAQISGGTDLVETFVTLAGALLDGIVHGISEVLESPTTLHGARLREEPEVTMLVGTHAPTDTVVFSTRLRIEIQDDVLTAHSHLLVEPKSLARLMSALSAASH